jgi:serine/threonine protein kinase
MGGGISSVAQNVHAPLCVMKKRYQINYFIGRGASSIVAHATDQENNIPVALKRVDLTTPSSLLFSLEQLAELSVNELRTFKRIGTRPFIVSLHAAFHSNSSCYMAMDYLGGGDLRRYLKKQGSRSSGSGSGMDEECVTYVVGCIGSALHHLHSQGVIHRDLKPENIALDLFGRPYLTDFGISLVSSGDNPIPICNSSSGTMAYLAPEVLTPSHLHSHQSDFWSLGVVAYELLFQQRPFKKHCPIPSVRFSADEYSSMWTDLLSLSSTSPLVDFETILMKTKQQQPTPHMQTSARGGLPNFRVLLSPTPSPEISLSDELSSMLNGLLDVRIHERLGNVNKYCQFSDHCLFQKHRFELNQLHRISSPLCASVEKLLSSPASIIAADALFDDEAECHFSPAVRNQLSEFHFLRSKVETLQLLQKIESIDSSSGQNSNTFQSLV